MVPKEENALMRQFAMRIFKDIEKYVATHQEEFEKWANEEEGKENG